MQVKSSPKSSKARARETQADSLQISNLQALTKELHKQQALNRLWLNQDFQQVLLPMLKQDNKWVDPRSSETLEKFHKEYVESWAMAKAFTELITLISGSEQRMRDIQNRIEKENLKHGTK